MRWEQTKVGQEAHPSSPAYFNAGRSVAMSGKSVSLEVGERTSGGDCVEIHGIDLLENLPDQPPPSSFFNCQRVKGFWKELSDNNEVGSN